MPEPIALDEVPGGETLFGDTADSVTPTKVLCPECDKEFMPSGINRHITMAHRGGVSNSSPGTKSKGSKVEIDIGIRWAQFQRGAALLVSFACSKCASVLVDDAEKDGAAIGQFCAKRPKLRKQVEGFLDTSDMLILVGTLGETAKTMAAHHSIGKRIGLNDFADDIAHDAHGGMQGIAQFMQSMSPEDRAQIIEQALGHMANGTGPTVPTFDDVVQPMSVPDIVMEDVPGAEPQPEVHADWTPTGA